MASVEREIKSLRDGIATLVTRLEVWDTLYGVCYALGLTVEENTDGIGKAKYLHKVVSDTDDAAIVAAGKQVLRVYPGSRGKPTSSDLQGIQDSIWWIESQGVQRVSNVARLRIAEALEGVRFWGRLDLCEFMASVLPRAADWGMPTVRDDGYLLQACGSSPLLAQFFGLRGAPEEPSPATTISTVDYLKALGLTEWPDARFCLFLERVVHPEVQLPDAQMALVDSLNPLLAGDGFVFRQEGQKGGLPVYKVRSKLAGVSGAPKYVIFASSGPKPDIVIDDAVSMDIRVVRYADRCLVYDEPPPAGDLTWPMLLAWWQRMREADPSIGDLAVRLRMSLQSAPERILFDTYLRQCGARYGANLPALLPQVYLHYDPRYLNERGRPVLARQRMDYLMLLREARRVVIEIDGAHHYSDNGRAVPARYAEMVAEDRRIRAQGYEVYRFGGAEFVDEESAVTTIVDFFDGLLDRHGIHPDVGRA